jgi:hypothetical protein
MYALDGLATRYPDNNWNHFIHSNAHTSTSRGESVARHVKIGEKEALWNLAQTCLPDAGFHDVESNV